MNIRSAQQVQGKIKGQDKAIWKTALTHELARLAQGMNNKVEGTNTIFLFTQMKYYPAK